MKQDCNTLTVPGEKSKKVSFSCSIMKIIFKFASRSRFPVKLIWCAVSGSSSSACCSFKSVAMKL